MGIRFIGALLLLVYSNVIAQGMPPNIENILRQTMAADGYLTLQMHEEFWKYVRNLGAPNEIELLKKTLNANVLGAQELQKEIWLSAKISYENKMVVKTERLIQLERELPIKFEETIAFPVDTIDYKKAMMAYEQRHKTSEDNTARLLNAAAQRRSMTSAQGEYIDLNIDMINTVIANLSKSFTRIKKLFDEEWNGE